MITVTKITVVAIALLILAGAALGNVWRIETVDTDGDVGRYSSIAIDSSGYPHISYYDGTSYDVKYARWNGSAWSISIVDSEGYIGHYSSIALDSNDNPHILYCEYTSSDVKYARWDGSTWNISIVDSEGGVGSGNSIVLDSSDNSHILYSDGQYLKYARWNGSSWEIHINTLTYGGYGCSIVLDSNNNPHISYCVASINADTGETIFDVKYTNWDGSTWSIDIVDTLYCHESSLICVNASIAVDSNCIPHISYTSIWSDEYEPEFFYGMSYAYWNGSIWEKVIIDTIGEYDESNSIVLDSGDNPHISYSSGGILKYAYWNGSSWEISTVDLGINCNSIALDSTGNPHISYRYGDYPVYNFRYARYGINHAPNSFSLLLPEDDSTVPSTVTLDWEDSSDDDDDELSYCVWYSEDESFAEYEEIADLTDSDYSFPEDVLDEGMTYYWKVKVTDSFEEVWCNEAYWCFEVEVQQDVEDDEGNLPTVFALHPATPNPSNGSASIGFALPRECDVELVLYDIKGRKIETLATGSRQPGEYTANVSGLSSGIYIYKLDAGKYSDTRKMVVK